MRRILLSGAVVLGVLAMAAPADAAKVTVPARHGSFQAGNAAACAHATNKARGTVVDQRSWCRAGGVTLS